MTRQDGLLDHADDVLVRLAPDGVHGGFVGVLHRVQQRLERFDIVG